MCRDAAFLAGKKKHKRKIFVPDWVAFSKIPKSRLQEDSNMSHHCLMSLFATMFSKNPWFQVGWRRVYWKEVWPCFEFTTVSARPVESFPMSMVKCRWHALLWPNFWLYWEQTMRPTGARLGFRSTYRPSTKTWHALWTFPIFWSTRLWTSRKMHFAVWRILGRLMFGCEHGSKEASWVFYVSSGWKRKRLADNLSAKDLFGHGGYCNGNWPIVFLPGV